MVRKILPALIASLLLLSAAIAQPPAKAVAFYKTGLDLKAKNMFPEAMVAFKQAVALYKNYDSALVEVADMYLRTSKPDSAMLVINNVLGINPAMSSAYVLMGNIYRDVRTSYDTALICYMNAVKADSNNKVAYYDIAWCYNAKGDYEKAIANGIRSLQIDNGFRPAYGELGHAYHKLKKFREAIEQFQKNLAVSVVDLPLFYSGLCYTELHDKENALKQYEDLKKINERLAGTLKKTIDKMQ